MEEQIKELLDLYGIEEALEVLDITPERVLEILLESGHVVLPEFLERTGYDAEGIDDQQS
jgi:GTP cyclohydrolase I